MANQKLDAGGELLLRTYRDMGDGTFAEVVAADLYPMAPNGVEPDQRLTVDATVGGVQLVPFGAATTHVFWTSEAAECRATFDGSAPTASNGHAVAPGSSGIWTLAMALAAKWIRTGGTSAVIHASPMKMG